MIFARRFARGAPRGCSSAGRAPPLQGGSQGFESPQFHYEPAKDRTAIPQYFIDTSKSA